MCSSYGNINALAFYMRKNQKQQNNNNKHLKIAKKKSRNHEKNTRKHAASVAYHTWLPIKKHNNTLTHIRSAKSALIPRYISRTHTHTYTPLAYVN